MTRVDRLRNEEVRRRAGVPYELAERVDESVLRWFGHVERMDEGRLTKRVWRGEVDGSRVRGRPRYGWTDGVRRALRARSVSLEEARDRVRDRNEWRMIVKSVR